MGRETGFFFGFNAGVISEEALQRVDQSSTRVGGKVQTNILPRKLGAAIFRPGLEMRSECYDSDSERFIPFVFDADDRALLELTANGEMRVLVDGVPVSRESVSTSISNPDFTASLANWTDDDETGGASTFSGGGHMSLQGNGTARARRYQSVTVSGGDQGTEHAVRIEVQRGPVYFSVGTTTSGDEVVAEQVLGQGTHSLAFTPNTSPIYIAFAWDGTKPALVKSCDIESSGEMVLPTPWNTVNRVREVQYAQSGDIVYCAQKNFGQRKIERRSNSSWSVVEYLPIDGPFKIQNASSITLTPASTNGSFQLTASRPLFSSGHVGSLWRLKHYSSNYTESISSEAVFTDPIRVSGIEEDREFDITIASIGSNTVTLQRAFGTPTAFEDFETYSANGSHTIDDERDNEIIYYRIGIATGDYSGGSTDVTITYSGSAQTGVVRVRSYASPTVVTVDAIDQLGSTDATRIWNAPEWSDADEWPTAVAFFDGRLWWAGTKIFGSVSDAYESFDDLLEGDAGTINRSLAVGSFDAILWLAPLQRLLAGTALTEISIQSSGFDEPITPTDFTARARGRRGSASRINPVMTDNAVIFVQRNRRRIYALTYSIDAQGYVPTDLTRLAPEVCGANVISMAVQYEPDTRVWFVLNNGSAVCLLFEPEDSAVAFVHVTTPGNFKAVTVLPSAGEDEVYFIVERNGTRLIERLASLEDARGGTVTKIMDSHVVYSGSPATTISGLDHLDGEDVVVWADGAPVNDQDNMLTVSSGSVTLASAASDVVVGLPYDGQFESAYLDYGAQLGVALGKPQRLVEPRLIAIHLGWNGLSVGPSLDRLSPLPPVYEGRSLDPTEVLDEYVHDLNVNSGWKRGLHLAFETKAPYPATLLAVAVDVETGEGVGD